MPNENDRDLVQDGFVACALSDTKRELLRRLKEKGQGTFASTHECLGIITEEYDELKEAIQANDNDWTRKELADIAVGCIFGIACIDAGTMGRL